MLSISEEEKLRRRNMVQSVIGTHTMEGIALDESARSLFAKYESGELTLNEFSAEMDTYALRLVAANPALAVVA